MAIYNPTDDNRLEQEPRQELVDAVIDQMLKDIQDGDFTAIQELLLTVPDNTLKSFLSEVPYA